MVKVETIVRDHRGRRYTGRQPKGRVCETEDCGHLLSIYNHDTVCARCSVRFSVLVLGW